MLKIIIVLILIALYLLERSNIFYIILILAKICFTNEITMLLLCFEMVSNIIKLHKNELDVYIIETLDKAFNFICTAEGKKKILALKKQYYTSGYSKIANKYSYVLKRKFLFLMPMGGLWGIMKGFGCGFNIFMQNFA